MALAVDAPKLAAMLRAERSDRGPAPNCLPIDAPTPPPSPAAATPAKSNFFWGPIATPMPWLIAFELAPDMAPPAKVPSLLKAPEAPPPALTPPAIPAIATAFQL